VVRFDATALWHFDAAERARSTTLLACEVVGRWQGIACGRVDRAGDHGFDVHVNPDCGSGGGPNGQPAAGMAAGGHYDPTNTGKHLIPQGEGHNGDMPVITVEASGKATRAVTVPHLTLADAKGRAIVIHAGGDNYSDQPEPLGGGGARIACGVVK